LFYHPHRASPLKGEDLGKDEPSRGRFKMDNGIKGILKQVQDDGLGDSK